MIKWCFVIRGDVVRVEGLRMRVDIIERNDRTLGFLWVVLVMADQRPPDSDAYKGGWASESLIITPHSDDYCELLNP